MRKERTPSRYRPALPGHSLGEKKRGGTSDSCIKGDGLEGWAINNFFFSSSSSSSYFPGKAAAPLR
jgi:hypothetical protein